MIQALNWAQDGTPGFNRHVVLAAVPDAEICVDDKSDIWVESATLGVMSARRLNMDCGNVFEDIWGLVRFGYKAVVDYERAHNPKFSAISEPVKAGDGFEGTCPKLKMRAYYYGFSETGVRVIDEILSAIAWAGKGFHHTESWADNECDNLGLSFDTSGMSYIEVIQRAAELAALAHASKQKEGERP